MHQRRKRGLIPPIEEVAEEFVIGQLVTQPAGHLP